VSRPGQWLHVAGQIGVDAHGSLAAGVQNQADAAWKNLLAILADADMGVQHLVKITTYLLDAKNLPAVNAVRKEYLDEHRPAATLVVVKELARPEWLFEIEATAFKED
jgi:enamine deaminase RidA (YjgF/YER057c/UK114 family)